MRITVIRPSRERLAIRNDNDDSEHKPPFIIIIIVIPKTSKTWCILYDFFGGSERVNANARKGVPWPRVKRQEERIWNVNVTTHRSLPGTCLKFAQTEVQVPMILETYQPACRCFADLTPCSNRTMAHSIMSWMLKWYLACWQTMDRQIGAHLRRLYLR